jgi:putative membrane protein
VLLSNPSVEIGCALFAGTYIAAARLTGNRFKRYQAWALAAAMIALIFALDGPLDRLEDARLFTAHMIQHLILALIVPPLLLIGTPDWILRPILSIRPFGFIARILVYPVVAYMFYALVLMGLHSPQIYDLMCRDDHVHIAMHLLLLVSATPLWWPLLSPLPEMPRLSYPAQMLYLFFWLIPMAGVAAPITMATKVIYPWYREGPHPFGLSPLSDQVLGGLVMWVGAGFYMIGVCTTIYFSWVRYDYLHEPEIDLTPIVPPVEIGSAARRAPHSVREAAR